MPTQKLTAGFVRTATHDPKNKDRTIYWDETLPGFGLMVLPSGHRSWVVQYRSKRMSRRATLRGVLPLDKARKQAKAIQVKVAEGGDPVLEERRANEAECNALSAVVEEFFNREGKKLRSAKPMRSTLDRLVLPRLGRLPIAEIRKGDITRMLDRAEDDSGPVMADRALAALSRVMNWHAGRVDYFVVPPLKGMKRTKPKERERDRVLKDDELQRVWMAAGDFPGPWGAFVRFLLLTATRRNEAAHMSWGELSGEEWTIAKERYKTGTEITLPLSKTALAILDGLPRIDGCRFVFSTNGRNPLTGFAKFKDRFDLACGVKDWRLHDLRRTARSLMSRAGVPSDHAERCLGHVIPGVRGVYDKHQYLEEMRVAFEALAAQIASVINSQDTVVPLRDAS
jgi:integrase